jgi:chlorobactene glucosyltransferase
MILFTDADTRHRPRLLEFAVGAALRTGADLVTVLPRQLMLSFWERMILPHIFIAILIRYRDLGRMNRSRNPRDVIANGQFILFRRASYEAVGGHEAVRGEIVEDLQLAQRVVASGRRLFAAHAEDLMATRMYYSFRGIVEGWSKNLASASRQTVPAWLRPALPWLIGLAMLAAWVVPPATFVTSAILGSANRWSAIASAATLVFWFTSYRRFRVPPGYAAVFPVGAVIAAALFFRSAALRGRVTWKGRTYETGAIGRVSGHAP